MGPKLLKGPGMLLPHTVAIAVVWPLADRLKIFTPSNRQVECATQQTDRVHTQHMTDCCLSNNKVYKTFISQNSLRETRDLQVILCPYAANAKLAFYLEDLKGEADHSLFSSVYGVVAVGVVGVVCWIIWRNHTTAGSCEVCAAP